MRADRLAATDRHPDLTEHAPSPIAGPEKRALPRASTIATLARPAQLQLIAGLEHIRQIRGDLAVVEPLDRELDELVLGRGGDRVAALSLITVLGGEADVDVLAGAVGRAS
jgi:hypothetical protein